MANITELGLKNLSQTNDGKTIMDGDGLIGKVRATKSGMAVYFEYRYRGREGKQRSISCGAWPDQTLKKIRLTRDGYRAAVSRGEDPLEDRRAAKLEREADQAEAVAREQARLSELAELQARMSVNDLFDRWSASELTRRKDGGAEAARKMRKDVLPEIGNMAVGDVRKGHVAAMLDKVLQRGGSSIVGVVLALTRQMFRYAVARDFIEGDPTALLEKKAFVGASVERDRVLSEAEVRELSAALPLARLHMATEAALWIQLATCCRIGELLKAEWSHLDQENGTWFIPAGNSKNKDEHTIYLSAFAIEKFKALREAQTSARWMFPASKLLADGSETHIDEKSVTKQVRDRQRMVAIKGRSKNPGVLVLSGGEWTPHDLRRTGATIMGELGVDGDVIDRCLNHRESNKIRRTYQRQTRQDEQRRAWALLGERLELLLRADGNVLTMKRKTAA